MRRAAALALALAVAAVTLSAFVSAGVIVPEGAASVTAAFPKRVSHACSTDDAGRIRTGVVFACFRRRSDGVREQLARVAGDRRQEAHFRRVDGREAQVAVVVCREHATQKAQLQLCTNVLAMTNAPLQERRAQAPRELVPADLGRVGGDEVRGAGVNVIYKCLANKVAWIDGEHLPADLEGECVRFRARERIAERLEDALDDIRRPAKQRVALIKICC